jgi:hypothetical protein
MVDIQFLEHMVRRLDSMASESSIIMQLKLLPESTYHVYQVLVDECQKHRSQKELEALKILFAWVAYCKDQLSLVVAKKFIEVVFKDSGISIDEELAGRSSRYDGYVYILTLNELTG